MAHQEQFNFILKIKNQYPEYFRRKQVLEIGSLNINGSVRMLFERCHYTGIDVGEGPGVDIVCPGQLYNAPDKTYDVVLSAECFEHNPSWLETFQNMIRMCKSSGLVLFTCATYGRPEHGTTRSTPNCSPLTVDLQWDYYKNLGIIDFIEVIDFNKHFSIYQFESRNISPQDLYFAGFKR